jgi:hypothetical protein
VKEDEKNIEFVDQKTEEKELRKTFIKDLITGSLLVRKKVTKQIPFMLYIVVLAIFYIANHYHAEKIYRTKMDLQNEIEELRAESITTASELIFISKRSEVNKMINEKGLELKESRVPPTKIK